MKICLPILCMFFLMLNGICSRAQIVTIPDGNFVTFLQTNYPSCITGDQLDTQCPEILAEDSLDVSYKSISDLTGAEYFVSLTWLKCSNNSIAALPPLPTGLTGLVCFANNLTALPALPTGLVFLSCGNNMLTTLPALPAGLVEFDCSSNYFITSLPTLPATLEGLGCSGNDLTSLPALPAGLITLYCGANQITALPPLPVTLEQLECGSNLLTVLPNLPDSLFYLGCQSNQLTFIPTLPQTMFMLDCANNLLQTLPDLPGGLETINISNNPDLACLPVLPPFLISTNGVTYGTIMITGTQITCIPNIPPLMTPGPFPLCQDGDLVNNPNGCENAALISGSVYTDITGNCIFDITESAGPGIKLLLMDDLNDTVGVTYTTLSGNYNFFIPGAGSYTLVVDTLNKPYEIQCIYPGADTSFVLATDSTIDVQFALNCPSGTDIGVFSVLTEQLVFPGQQHTLHVFAGDLVNLSLSGCSSASVSGTVEITVTGGVNYINSAPYALVPASVSGNVFTYVIPDFSVVEPDSAFTLLFETQTTASFGDSICVDVVINTGITDLIPSNDSSHFCYPVLNSLDPNIKEVYPTLVEPGYNDWLTYTIHFQNTGNAPAYNIKLKDTLSTLVNPNSFELLAYSHPVSVELNGPYATFKFDNILLPDSVSDPEGSIGYIQYRVKPLPNLPEGTEINNKAYIFFDYNAAIITNTATTSFEIDESGLAETEINSLTLYPNPGNGIFSFELPASYSDETSRLLIYNLAGELVQQELIQNTGLITVNGTDLKPGIYFMTLNGNDQTITCKLVKQ